jgi:hypothetical protein
MVLWEMAGFLESSSTRDLSYRKPGIMIRVYRKWKLPIVGEIIKFIRLPFEKHANWDRGLVDELRDVGGRALYLIARL